MSQIWMLKPLTVYTPSHNLKVSLVVGGERPTAEDPKGLCHSGGQGNHRQDGQDDRLGQLEGKRAVANSPGNTHIKLLKKCEQ
jgi:hypothetical protein